MMLPITVSRNRSMVQLTMTSRKLLIILQCFCFLLRAAVAQESGAVCQTREGQEGRCIEVKKCPYIVKMLQTSPLTESVREQLKQDYCGVFHQEHHVCCEIPIIRKSEDKSSASVETGLSILQEMNCGNSGGDRVANGVDAILSEYPWMALLQYNDGGFGCGGSLITSQYVLTAAHCIDVPRKKLTAVRLGEHDLGTDTDCTEGRSRRCAPPVQDIKIEEAIYHKDYSNTLYHNDIGLIRLATKATIGSSVKPICLPITPTSRAADINMLIISGWGKMETGYKARILQKALVKPIENNKCKDIFKTLVISENQMCARGDNEVDACKGDSGGPAFFPVRYKRAVRYVQYGIVSAGVIQCGSQYPGIYMRIRPYLDWIAGNIRP